MTPPTPNPFDTQFQVAGKTVTEIKDGKFIYYDVPSTVVQGTPRTDAIQARLYSESLPPGKTIRGEYASFARILERELIAVKAQLAAAQADTARLDWLEANAGTLPTSYYRDIINRVHYRTAIDAARKEQSQ